MDPNVFPQDESAYVSTQGYPNAPVGNTTLQGYHHAAPRSDFSQQWNGSATGPPRYETPGYGYDSRSLQDGAANQEQNFSSVRTLKRKRSENGSGTSNRNAPPSKRALKRAKILQEYGSIGAQDAPKGKTRMEMNGLEWWDEDTQTWRPAAPHDDFRREFILEDSMFGSYDFRPDCGEDDLDITSFAFAYGQQHWNVKERSTWGDIRDAEGNEVLFLLEKPVRETEPEYSGYMMYNGLVMLDPDDNPVKDWPGVPRCFSSKVEGGRVEALRRIVGMTIPDFRARMPRITKTKNGVIKPLFGLTSINQRLSRFRENNECPAWLTREKAGGMKKHTLARLAAHGAPPGSTAGLPPPSDYERERRKLENVGKHPEKAAGRSVTEEERAERTKKRMKRIQRLESQERLRQHSPTVQHARYQSVQDRYEYSEPSLDDTTAMKCKPDDGIHNATDLLLMEPAQKRSRAYSSASIPLEIPEFNFDDATLPSSSLPEFLDFEVGLGNNNKTTEPAQLDSSLATGDSLAPTPASPRDMRFVTPKTLVEQWSIKSALLHTAIDYQIYHGAAPPLTAEDKSYAEQYQELQASHEAKWCQPSEIPMLVSLGEWFGSFNQIPMPALTEAIAGRFMSDSSNDDANVRPQNTIQSVKEAAYAKKEPELKNRPIDTHEQQLTAQDYDIKVTTGNESQGSADETVVRYENLKMVEQFGPLANEELLAIIDANDFDLSAWDPNTLPSIEDFSGLDGMRGLPQIEDVRGGNGQGLLT